MAFRFEMRFYDHPSGRGDKGSEINCVSDPGGEDGDYTSDLGEDSGRVISVTMWVLGGVEGRTLVLCQRDTVLDAQWQVGLES